MKRKALLSIFIIILILLFSMAILAKDLSKEEIVNELKKITIIANKDIRLEMYDILAEKLGLKVADDPGFMIFQVYLYDGEGNLVGVAANQTKPGKGSFYNPKKGTFYLTINTMSDWEIKIIVVE
jgi:hypothetical protein